MLMKNIKEYEAQVIDEKRDYLSKPVCNIILSMIKFKGEYDKLANELDGTDPPLPKQQQIFYVTDHN